MLTIRAAPMASADSISASMTSIALGWSSWPVGSSARMRRGLPARTRAMATRWDWPPDNSSGSFDAIASNPRRRRASIAAARAALRSTPCSKSGNSTFSTASSGGNRLGPWKTTAIGPGRRCSMSPRDGQSTTPTVGRSRPASRCNNVVLPDPEAPTRATCSPVRTAHEAPCTATTAAGPRPNVRATPCARTTKSPLMSTPGRRPT